MPRFRVRVLEMVRTCFWPVLRVELRSNIGVKYLKLSNTRNMSLKPNLKFEP